MARIVFLMFAPMVFAVLFGCRTGGTSAGDVLRRENLELQRQVAQLEKDASELRAKIAELVGASGRDGGSGVKSAEVVEATPRVAGIDIDFLSGPTADSSSPPQSDRNRTVAVYIRPFDGRSRFVQATGTLTVEVSRLPALSGGAPESQTAARPIASKTLAPLELREAFRAGFTGTYYVVDLPVAAQEVQPPGQILVRAHFADAITGATFDATRVIGLR